MNLLSDLPDNTFTVDVHLGDIEINSEVGVLFTDPELKNNGTFWTDSNGLEMIKRKVRTEAINYYYGGGNQNYLATVTSSVGPEHRVEENMYPVTSAIKIIDNERNRQLLVMNDRAQAGQSINEGEIFLVQNRRLNSMDGKGLQE